MVGEINDDIERYALVLVDCKRGEVKHIECVIPIAYMNPMYREDWSEYINAEYVTENYHLLAPTADLEANDTVLPVLGTLTVTEVEA